MVELILRINYLYCINYRIIILDLKINFHFMFYLMFLFNLDLLQVWESTSNKTIIISSKILIEIEFNPFKYKGLREIFKKLTY